MALNLAKECDLLQAFIRAGFEVFQSWQRLDAVLPSAHHQTCPGSVTTVKPPRQRALFILHYCVAVRQRSWSKNVAAASQKFVVVDHPPLGWSTSRKNIQWRSWPPREEAKRRVTKKNGSSLHNPAFRARFLVLMETCVWSVACGCVYEAWLLPLKIYLLYLSLPPRQRPASVCRKSMATHSGSLSPSGMRVWLRVTFMLSIEISCIKKYFEVKTNPTLRF